MAAAEQIGAIVRFTREYEQIGISAPVWHDCRSLSDKAAGQSMHIGGTLCRTFITREFH